MNRRLVVRVIAALLAVALLSIPAAASGKGGKGGKGKGKDKALVVCKHGCKYRTIQKAVNKSGKNDTIEVKPGKYVEGVIVEGKKHKGLTIEGTKKKKPKKVILDGKNAKGPDGLAQNGIEAIDVNDLTIKNMWARNYAANGFFVHDSDPAAENNKIECNDYLVKNVVASFNRSYGVYAFGCAGGRITKSTGFGHGDSAFYIGGTPIQTKPKPTTLDHLDGHENVLGYSGTNSRYVTIRDSNFYNNGVGIVPNTLDSEPFEPTSDGVIEDNNIFWNNFNYFLPNSRVKTVSDGLGEVPPFGTLQYPTGVGVALFGATGWTVQNNNIFGNFKWGAAEFSDPFNDGDDATSTDNQFIDNTMGRAGADTNGFDFWADGSGSGNCFSGNDTSTFDPSDSATTVQLYPPCPAPPPPVSGSGTSHGDNGQVVEILDYTTTDPPENQQCKWETNHSHPAFQDFVPLTVTPGPNCTE
jgi:hypothetical protein